MILKQKKTTSVLLKLFLKISKFFNKILYFLGYIFLILIIFSLIFYYSSTLNKIYDPKQIFLKVNDKILAKYIGFDFRLSKDYLDIIFLNLTKKIRPNKLENIYIKINQKSILGLEMQREIKKKSGGPIPDELKIWYPANINFRNNNYKVKIKLKGNRHLHWYNPRETSYKIDIRGDKYILNMEEFSFQKPITKNYTYEFLFHKLLGHVGLTHIDYRFVNLYFNDQNLGIFAMEEAFSNQLLVKQKKTLGPIFSIKDEYGEQFPNIFFELYSKDYWLEKNPELINNLFIILNNIKLKNKDINNYFDLDKWAKYFAIIDLSGAYHGALLDSVKLYFNTDANLFEPIGYDLHKGAGEFNNFIMMDFLDERIKPECSWICDHRQLFELFLKNNNGDLNDEFIEKYSFYLNKYSEDNFLNNFLEENSNTLTKYNSAIYSDNSKTDKIGWKGLGYFVYDEDYLKKRKELIRSRITSINLKNALISFDGEHIFFENFFMSKFPIKGKLLNCDNADEKTFFFAGNMKKKQTNDCKYIRLTDFNNNYLDIELKNRPEINY